MNTRPPRTILDCFSHFYNLKIEELQSIFYIFWKSGITRTLATYTLKYPTLLGLLMLALVWLTSTPRNMKDHQESHFSPLLLLSWYLMKSLMLFKIFQQLKPTTSSLSIIRRPARVHVGIDREMGPGRSLNFYLRQFQGFCENSENSLK